MHRFYRGMMNGARVGWVVRTVEHPANATVEVVAVWSRLEVSFLWRNLDEVVRFTLDQGSPGRGGAAPCRARARADGLKTYAIRFTVGPCHGGACNQGLRENVMTAGK
jgi:hypothetical protein